MGRRTIKMNRKQRFSRQRRDVTNRRNPRRKGSKSRYRKIKRNSRRMWGGSASEGKSALAEYGEFYMTRTRMPFSFSSTRIPSDTIYNYGQTASGDPILPWMLPTVQMRVNLFGVDVDACFKTEIETGSNTSYCQSVLIDTLKMFDTDFMNKDQSYENYYERAMEGIDLISEKTGECEVSVSNDDWGVATQKLTEEYNTVFAVLNMAHGKHMGGGYHDGLAAQEENIFRRTNCHFCDYILDKLQVPLPPRWKKKLGQGQGQGQGWAQPPYSYKDTYNQRRVPGVENGMYVDEMTGLPKVENDIYVDEITALVRGDNDKCYLDMCPRVCIKGPQIMAGGTINTENSYQVLETPFPFYELRSAAPDLRTDMGPQEPAFFTETDDRFVKNDEHIETELDKRILGQLQTLKNNGVRHVVLSAWGCGAFKNDPMQVARIYHKYLTGFEDHFNRVHFAIYYPGYGDDNVDPFRKQLAPPWGWYNDDNVVPYDDGVCNLLDTGYTELRATQVHQTVDIGGGRGVTMVYNRDGVPKFKQIVIADPSRWRKVVRNEQDPLGTGAGAEAEAGAAAGAEAGAAAEAEPEQQVEGPSA